MRSRLATVFVTVLALAGCAMITLVETTRQEVGGAYSVDPQIEWNRIKSGSVEVWTVDGLPLESLRFFVGIGDGESLVPAPGAKMKLPKFHATMTALEVQEVVIDTIAALGGTAARAANLRPASFGDAPGFHFDLSFVTGDGLETDGMAAGAVVDGKLHLILFTAARMHYFPRYRPQVEKLFESVRVG